MDERAKEGRHEKQKSNPGNNKNGIEQHFQAKRIPGDIKPVEHVRRKQNKDRQQESGEYNRLQAGELENQFHLP